MLKLSPTYKLALGIGITIGLTVVCVVGAIWVTHTQSAELGNARARCQTNSQVNHVVQISGDKVVPEHTDAKICDKLTIVNLDKQTRIMAFGPHDHHISYDGVSERLLNQNQSMSVTLITPGTYLFHDHEQANVFGTFTAIGTPGRN